jgi:hypothetical protein
VAGVCHFGQHRFRALKDLILLFFIRLKNLNAIRFQILVFLFCAFFFIFWLLLNDLSSQESLIHLVLQNDDVQIFIIPSFIRFSISKKGNSLYLLYGYPLVLFV